MTIYAFLALFGWIPAVLMMFALLPRRIAVSIAVIGGWLVLPPYSLSIAGLPDYSKITTASLAVALGTFIFCPDRILMFRPRWFDLPMLLWCFFSSIASSVQNGLGLYDGCSDAVGLSMMWGLPYLIGRLHFGDPDSLSYFAVAMTVGGLCCVLPCGWEMKAGPMLLKTIYGAADRSGYIKGTRFGGYRPQLFFWTGLELGLWMAAATLTGWWLWRCGALKKIGQIPFGPVLLPVLTASAIFCRSTGAVVLMTMGVMILWLSVRLRTRLLIAALLLVGPLYVAVRTTKLWSGEQAVAIASVIGADRAASLQYRLDCEDLLLTKALQQPVYGWGGWGRSDVYRNPDMEWRQRVVTDGLWIIILGIKGYVGLILLYMAMVLPAFAFVWRFPPRLWADPRVAASSLTAVLLGLYVIDCLLNAFPNMIYIVLGGGLIGLEPRQIHALTVGRGGEARDQTSIAMARRMGQISLADHNHRLGRTLKAEGRLHEADAVWVSTLDLLGTMITAHPDQPDLWRRWCDCANDLAWLELNHPELAHGDLASLIAMAQRVVEACPEGATYWNTLGVAYFRGGDDASAVTALDRATALGGGTAFDDIFLAMAHARLGNRELAERLLAQTIVRMERDGPGHPELVRFCDEARSILTEGSTASL